MRQRKEKAIVNPNRQQCGILMQNMFLCKYIYKTSKNTFCTVPVIINLNN